MEEDSSSVVIPMEEDSSSVVIPMEMLEEIGKRLSSPLDTASFRSVCPSCLPPPERFPLNIRPPPCVSQFYANNFPFFITQSTVYTITLPDNGFKKKLLMFDEVDQGGVFRPWEFRFREQQQQQQLRLDDFPDKLSSINSPLTFIAKFYHLHFAYPTFDIEREPERVPGRFSFRDYRRLIVQVVPMPTPTGVDPNYASDLAFVALFNGGRLGIYHLPNSNWRMFPGVFLFDDIVCCKAKLWGVDSKGAAFVMDDSSFDITRIAPPPPLPPNIEVLSKSRVRLVEASGDLYLLVSLQVVGGMSTEPAVPSIKVFRLTSKPQYQWLEVQDFGNQHLFVGYDYSFSCQTRDHDHVGNPIKSSGIFCQGFSFCWLKGYDNDNWAHEKWFFEEVDKDNVSSCCTPVPINGFSLRCYSEYSRMLASKSSSPAPISSSTPTSRLVKQFELSSWCNWDSDYDLSESLSKSQGHLITF